MTAKLSQTQKQALYCLVEARHNARRAVKAKTHIQEVISHLSTALESAISLGDRKAEASFRIDIEELKQLQVEIRFQIIELGQQFAGMSTSIDEVLPKDEWLRALCVNESEWHSESMKEYGTSIQNVVSVLKLENSATKDDSITSKPLAWCSDMAMLNAIKTNPKLDKAMHEKCNEMFSGAFGEWQEPSILKRLGAA